MAFDFVLKQKKRWNPFPNAKKSYSTFLFPYCFFLENTQYSRSNFSLVSGCRMEPARVSDANELLQKAQDLLQKPGISQAELEEAEYIFDSILSVDVDNAEVLFSYGNLLLKKGQNGLARQVIQRACEMNPRANFLNNLAVVEAGLGRIEPAREALRKAIEMNPDEAQFPVNLAGLYPSEGVAEEGLRLCEKVLRTSPGNPSVLTSKSLLLLELGKWGDGFDLYDYRLVTQMGESWGRAEKHYHAGGTPFWDGKKTGLTVAVYGEQGLGDELMFASLLPDAASNAQIIFDANARLANLFQRSFPGIAVHGTSHLTWEQLAWLKTTRIDAKLPIGSLARFYRRRTRDFPRKPYLKANPSLVNQYSARLNALGSKPKIGISWMGGTPATRCQYRFIPFFLLEGMLRLEADFISLQYNPGAENDFAPFCQEKGLALHHWPEILQAQDYDGTAALVANLDLVISVPQSVVHLAGGLGIPTWQMAPRQSAWQVGPFPGDPPWYGCVKNYWQGDDKNWKPVIQNVTADLKTFLARKAAA